MVFRLVLFWAWIFSRLGQRNGFADIDSCLPQQFRNRILLEPGRVKLYSHRSLFLVEPYPTDPIHLAHAVDGTEFALSGLGSVVENNVQISHAWQSFA